MIFSNDPFYKVIALSIGALSAAIKHFFESLNIGVLLTGTDDQLIEIANNYFELEANLFMIVSFALYLLLNLKNFKERFFNKSKDHVRKEKEQREK